MIIQIRGTSGSGKSWVMRRVMALMGDWQAEYRKGRKQPLYYRSENEWPPTVVLGHYESPCGGCDTIGSAKAIYELIQKVIALPDGRQRHILCEGLLLSEDVKWTSQLTGIKVLFLVTPLDKCLQQIEERRKAVGNDKPLNPGNTSRRVAVIERGRIKLMGLDIPCYRTTANQAPGIILDWLKRAD